VAIGDVGADGFRFFVGIAEGQSVKPCFAVRLPSVDTPDGAAISGPATGERQSEMPCKSE
jgi:hypothetical protein